MKKRLLGCILICLLTLILSIGVTFAYFNVVSSSTKNITFTTVGNDGIEVDSFYIFKVLTHYTNGGLRSDIAQRKNLVFTKDIKLESDLVISRDINIDFGGNTFNLGSYKLSFKHNFAGSITLTNGTISSDSENPIDCLTPRSAIVYDTVLVKTTFNVINFDDAKLTDLLAKHIVGNMQSSYAKDIPLIKEFSGYNLNFKWESNKPTIVSNTGRVTPLANTEEVVLTLTVSGDISLTMQFTVKIYKASAEMCEFAIEKFDNYFNKYQLLPQQYYIYSNIALIENDLYTNATYTYETIKDNIVTTGDNILNNVLLKSNISRSFVLTVTAKIGEFTAQKNYNLNIVVADNYEIANEIVNSIGDGLILIADKTSTILLPTADELKAKGISNADVFKIGKYEDGIFLEDTSKYIIEDNKIKVVGDPNATDEYFLQLNLHFVANNPVQLTLYSRIYYTNSTSGGGSEGIDPLSYWYNTLHEEILNNKTNNGSTFLSFDLPNEWYGKPVTYGISESEFVNPSTNSLFEGILNVERKMLVTTFNIDLAKLNPNDLRFVMFYKFAENAESWYSKKTKLTIDGIIHNNFSGVVDTNLYNALLELYDKNLDGVITLTESNNESIKDLTVNMALTTLKGIEFFGSIRNLNLDRTATIANKTAYLASFENLKLLDINKLSLQNNGLVQADLVMLPSFPNLAELNLSNSAVEMKNSFTNLANLPLYLKLVNFSINDCSLKNLSGIEKLFSLKTLNVNDNEIRSFRNLLDLKELDTIYAINNLNGTDFGSEGKYSVSVWTLLYNKKSGTIKIYNKNTNGTSVLFKPTSEQIKGVGVLESIMLQTKLYITDVLILPKNIFINDTTSYEIVWDTTNLVGATVTTSGDNYHVANLSAGANVELYAKVTISFEEEINGVVTSKNIDIFRSIIIEQIRAV